MGIRLGDLQKWEALAKDKGAKFPGERRNVVLEVSAPQETNLYVEYELPADDTEGFERAAEIKEQFLARVEGKETVEFTVDGDFTLFADGDCLIYTADGAAVYNIDIAPVIFTRIANRKVRNRNVEMMEWQMRQNLERRMAAMEEEAFLRLQDRVNRYAPQRNLGFPPGPTSGEPAEGPGEEPRDRDVGTVAKDEGKVGKAGKGGKQSPPAIADD